MKLSQLELAVVVQLARGYKPCEIQAALGINKKQYARCRTRIMDKLNACNDAQIGAEVVRRRLLSEDEFQRIEDRRQTVLRARALQ